MHLTLLTILKLKIQKYFYKSNLKNLFKDLFELKKKIN